MMRLFLVTSAVLLLCTGSAHPTHAYALPDTLALVGTSVISSEDLVQRIDLMPWPEKRGTHVSDTVKLQALHSLIAEKLLAREASVRGLGHDSTWARQLRQIERMMVRDALFRREVRGKVMVTDEELQTALRRTLSRIRVFPFLAPTSRDAQAIRDRLLRLPSPDSVRSAFPGGHVPDTIAVQYGRTDPQIEDTAETLGAGHRVSRPFRTEDGRWMILYFLGRETDPLLANRSITERLSIAEERLRSRKESALGESYSASVLRTTRAETHAEVFEVFAEALLRTIRSDSSAHWIRGRYRLSLSDLDAIATSIDAMLDTELISMPEGGMSVADVLEAMKYQEPGFETLHPQGFRVRLNQHLRTLAGADLLSHRGIREGLDQSPEVRHDVALWDDARLARLMRQEIARSVTITHDDLIRALQDYAMPLAEKYEVNVREILSESLASSFKVLDSVSRGADFSVLAARHSIRKDWARRGGESGYFVVSAHPALGFAAIIRDSGTVGGPLRLPEGYSVFIPLGVRAREGQSVPTPDSLTILVRDYVISERTDRAVQSTIASLADRELIHVDMDRLRRITPAPFNMVTRRFIGFGGVMMAAPILAPNVDWVREVKDPRALVP